MIRHALPLAILLSAIALGAAAPTPAERLAAEIKAGNAAFATNRLAILKIDDVIYIRAGQRAFWGLAQQDQSNHGSAGSQECAAQQLKGDDIGDDADPWRVPQRHGYGYIPTPPDSDRTAAGETALQRAYFRAAVS